MKRTFTPLGIALVFVLGAAPPARTAAPPQGDQQIARWIRELDDDRFAVRQAAHDGLLHCGKRAIPALTGAAASESLEVIYRVLRIFRVLVASMDPATAEKAQEALERLTSSNRPLVAQQARLILLSRRDQVVSQLKEGGCHLIIDDDKIVAVILDPVAKLAPLLPVLRQLSDMETLIAGTKQMDASAVAQLKGTPRLRKLDLVKSGLTDAGL